MEATHDMYRKIDLSPLNDGGDYHVSLDDIFENDITGDNVSQTRNQEESIPVETEAPTSSKKRRRSGGFDDKFFEALHEVGRGSEARLETISCRMGYDFDVSKARKEVNAKLSGIPSLSQNDKFVGGRSCWGGRGVEKLLGRQGVEEQDEEAVGAAGGGGAGQRNYLGGGGWRSGGPASPRRHRCRRRRMNGDGGGGGGGRRRRKRTGTRRE
ncbi:uncharacterized protein LOC131026093 [Salvia miltiorrhiza]|uniref:uncharacterized protein LOC131026093 n=1 Tax=Salvia miltiorrhiza TaxID=226208 RepID=UPI0025AC68C2|nr:uncharacterized protein LOC131026093 [Salvia miltiorrhiza]